MTVPFAFSRLTGGIRAWARCLEAGAIILAACLISLLFKLDNNWDLRNYHIYSPFAFWEGRVSRDLYAAGPQTYFNPLLDVPYYLLAVRLIPDMPRLVAFLSGIPFGLLGLTVLSLARVVLPPAIKGGNWLAIGAAAAGMTGTATTSEIGTTFGDIPVAILLLVGLIGPFALLRDDQIDLARWLRSVLVAGFLIGAAAGLKLTACIFAPGAALALAVTVGGTRRFLLTGMVFCAAWAVGFGIAFGWWGLTVYRIFGNPVFPFLNNIFESPWVPPAGGRDDRFLPQGLWEALFFPFFWLRGRPFVVAEFGVRDPRAALAYISVIIIIADAAWRRLRGVAAQSRIAGKPVIALCVFSVISFVVWEKMFSILRYALALEVVTGILIVLALLILLEKLPRDHTAGWRTVAIVSAVLAMIFAVSSRPGWGRIRTYGAAVFEVEGPMLPDRAVVVFADRPTAFIAPFLKGHDLLFVGIADGSAGSRLDEEISRRIKARPSIMAVIYRPPAAYETITRNFGFRILDASCTPIHNVYEKALAICSGEKTDLDH